MKYFYSLVVLILFYSCSPNDGVQKAIIETDLGKIEVMLYNETPLHKENFIKLVKEKYYDGLLFHRVIQMCIRDRISIATSLDMSSSLMSSLK